MTALISVSDKTNLQNITSFLLNKDYKILSTGGTYSKLINDFPHNHQQIIEVASYTNFPEFLDGRVKTLHPKIHGGLLAKRDNESHMQQLEQLDILPISIIICNLYPFKETIKKGGVSREEIIENIDIGGHTLIRAASKNYKDVLVITDINDYQDIIDNFNQIDREKYAQKAFQHIMEYDISISNYFNQDNIITRVYQKERSLKYGINPQQKNAGIYRNVEQDKLPFEVLNGNAGYINILDAIYSWNLVKELDDILDLPAAASFKHTSPAGAAVYVPIEDKMKKIYNIPNSAILTPTAIAFIRARNADPMCSYGDFIAVSRPIDIETAKVINMEVSDGIIALDYSNEALEILKKKKNGAYVILKAQPYLNQNQMEIKELHGVALIQEENKKITTLIEPNIITHNKIFNESIKRDMIVANTTLKYTQSNSVVYVKDGQCVGIGAGQQSRIDCVKLAKRKVEMWYLRQHPRCVELFDLFKQGTKRQMKTNAIVQYIDGDFTEIEFKKWRELFVDNYEYYSLTNEDKNNFLNTLTDITLGSDAFFPFRDNIDTAAKIGVKYIIQPCGSIADNEVIEAANEYDMMMVATGSEMRMFLH